MERRSTGLITISGRSSSSSDRQIAIEDALDASLPSSSTGRSSLASSRDSFARGKDSLYWDDDSFIKWRDLMPKNKKRFRLKPKAAPVQEEEYDFSIIRSAQNTNIKQGIAALVKGCLGGGMVSLHEAYMECGLWAAVGINIVMGIVVTYCMYIFTQSAQLMYARIKVTTLSYPDLAEAAIEIGPWERAKRFSRYFRHLVETFICISDFGACCAYQVVIAHSVHEIFQPTNTFGTTALSLQSARIYTAGLLIPCALLAVFTTVKELAPFSVVANFYVVLIAVTTIYYGVKTANGSPWDLPGYRSVLGLFKFTGVVMFSLDGIGSTLAVENGIKNPKHVPYVLAGGMSIVVLITLVIGFFGYWGFGDKCVSPVTINFPWFIYPITLKMFLAMMIFVTFGFTFCNPFSIVWYYISLHHDPEWHWVWERVYRTIAVTVLTLLAIAFPNINHIIGLLGSFCFSHTGFIFPAIISLAVEWEKPGLGRFYWRIWKSVLLIILGWFLFIVGTTTNSYKMVMDVYFPNSTTMLF